MSCALIGILAKCTLLRFIAGDAARIRVPLREHVETCPATDLVVAYEPIIPYRLVEARRKGDTDTQSKLSKADDKGMHVFSSVLL